MSKNAIILRKNLNKDQNDEYELLKNISEKLIVDNYHRNPIFQIIIKTSIGYTVTRRCHKKVFCHKKVI